MLDEFKSSFLDGSHRNYELVVLSIFSDSPNLHFQLPETETSNWCLILEWFDVFYLNNTLLDTDPHNRLVFSLSKTVVLTVTKYKSSTCPSVTSVSFPEQKSLFYMGGTIVNTL